jgi:cytochrome c553
MKHVSPILAALLLAASALSSNASTEPPIGKLIYLPAQPSNIPANMMAVPVAIWSNGQVFMQWMLVPAQAVANMPAIAGSAPAIVTPIAAAVTAPATAAVTTATTAAASAPAAAVSAATSVPAAIAAAPGTAAAAAVSMAGKFTGSTATHARSMAATCYSCHGTDGKSHSAIPPLAGMDKSYFIEQMKDFKSGKREATVMHQHARGYTDEEFAQMADVFAAIKP